MFKRYIGFSRFLPLFYLASTQASPDAPALSMDELMGFSLKELMQVEIYTASQVTEKAAASASITSVITAQQLKDWGIINIHDVLSLLPGVVKSETYIAQTTQTFRGITPGLFNNKSLYLINGHPAYESLFGSTLADYVPIEIIDRIEVVRSPASVLYGTNAVSGVINIITRKGEEGNSVKLRGGSHGHVYGNFTHMGDGLSVSGSIQRDDGYDYDGTLDEQANEVNFPYKNDIQNLFVDAYGDDWRINLAYFDQAKAKFGINPWVWHQGDFETYSYYLDANKRFDFDTGELNVWLRYDLSDKDIQAGEFPYPLDCSAFTMTAIDFTKCNNSNPASRDTSSTVFNTVERYTLEVQYKDSISDTLSYIIGASTHTEKSDPLLFIYDSDGTINPFGAPISESKDTTTNAVYGQLKYQPAKDIVVIAGVRGEDEDDSGSSGLVPRVGVSYQIKPDTYLKAMYSEAYRTPVFIEKYVLLSGVLFGNPDLKRETIKTTELALDTQLNSENKLQLALFNIQFEDEIIRVPQAPPSNAAEYINGEGKDMNGLEIEWQSIISKQLELIANVSHVQGEDNSLGESDAPFIAEQTANLMLTYMFNQQWKAGLTVQYVGEKESVFTTLQTPTLEERETIDAYSLVNFNVQYHHKQHALQLILNNIFDEDYTYPEPVRRNIPEVPGGPAASGYLQYSYSFQ